MRIALRCPKFYFLLGNILLGIILSLAQSICAKLKILRKIPNIQGVSMPEKTLPLAYSRFRQQELNISKYSRSSYPCFLITLMK